MALMLAATLIVGMAFVAPARAATVYELEGEWGAQTPGTVEVGDSITATWWANVNDDAEAPGNAPVNNVTVTVIAVGARFEQIPSACRTNSVNLPSSISADGKTLVCNGGTFKQGTALRLETAVTVTAAGAESVYLSAAIADQSVDLPKIPVKNEFFMDIAWAENARKQGTNKGSFDMSFNWTLFHGATSANGPETVTYTLDVSNSVNSPMQIGPNACSAFTQGGAVGHPWSGGGKPANQTAPFVADCTLTLIEGTKYQLTLSGIDYSHTKVPTRDSAGHKLPAARVAVASGEVQFRVLTENKSGSISLTSSAPMYASASGATASDNPGNNSSVNNWVVGFHTGHWNPSRTGSGTTVWSDTYRVGAGLEVESVASVNYATVAETATEGGLCVILDTEHATYSGYSLTDVQNGGAPLNAPVEYLVAASPLTDPNGAQPCGDDTLNWVSSPPTDLSTVRGVRANFQMADVGTNSRPILWVRQVIDQDAVGGQDIWMWSAFRGDTGNADWVYPSRTTDPKNVPNEGVVTPDSRYPYTGAHRDVLRIVPVFPVVKKSVNPTVVDPGGSAKYTLVYSAEGSGDVAETVDGYEIVDTLPTGTTYVAGSSSNGTPVYDAASRTLKWTLDDVPTNKEQMLTYEVAIAKNVENGSRLVNRVTASVDGFTSRQSTASTTVVSAVGTSIVKTADQAFIPNLKGDGAGKGSWTVDVVSADPVAQAFTDTIDILPYNGDGRGTSMAGTYQLSGPVTASREATVYYATVDPTTLSDDPADPMNGAAGDPASSAVGWSTTFAADATAVRVVTKNLEPRGRFNFTVPIVTDKMKAEDVLVNRAQGRAGETRLVMRTSASTQIANFYSASLKKQIQDVDGGWHDANDPATYPEFHVGDTVRYRVVVNNTGQGTLTNIMVSDDQQPKSGAFTIKSLAPGESFTHEYAFVLEEATSEDAVVNTACAKADTPSDSVDDNGDPLPPEINCDPAGFTPVGQTKHTKELVSAAPIGGGQWKVIYEITVESTQIPATYYDLADELHFNDQATITSAEITKAPEGVTLAAPAWNGQDKRTVVEHAAIKGKGNPGYVPHVYQVTVVADVPLQLNGAGSGADDPRTCGVKDGVPQDRAFTNISELTKSTGDVEVDEACAELPSISIDKSITEGPVPNGDGTWTVSYDVVAKNTGAAAGVYDISDQMTAGGDLDVTSAAVVATPEGVTAKEGWTGRGDEGAAENVIATDVTLPGGGMHTYQVEVVLGIAQGIEGDPDIAECPAESGGDSAGLANTAEIEHNGRTATDQECASVAAIGIAKSISAGPVANGDGTFTITYDLVAENTGGAAGDYVVVDRLLYGEGIEVTDAGVIAAPEGVTAKEGWTGRSGEGAAENVVAAGVRIGVGVKHTYQVEVTVSLDREKVTPAALACPDPGSGDRGGLANFTALTHNGIVDESEVCASLPLIDITKSLAGAVQPVDSADGVYDVTYELLVTNSGMGEVNYDLTDTLTAGEGIEVIGVQDISTDAPDAEINDGFDGVRDHVIVTDQPIAGAGERVVTHSYFVTVRYSVDVADADIPTDGTCSTAEAGPAPGALDNRVAVNWNGTDEEDEECIQVGKPTLDKELVSAEPVGDGQWKAVYDITVGSVGGLATSYDLDDEFRFAADVTVNNVQLVGPAGVTLNTGFNGSGDTRIATDVTLAGLDSDDYAPHVYTVTVLVDVPMQFEDGQSDGADSPACTEPAGSNTFEQGLNNAATLTDENGNEFTDTDCGELPSISIDKQITGEPVQGADGEWTVTYEITAKNNGAAEGVYTLTDQLRFGTGIKVASAAVIGAPDGVTAAPSWTGQGAQGAEANVMATDVTLGVGGMHTYRVQVKATLGEHTDVSTFGCGEVGSGEPAGFRNVAGIEHNDLTQEAEDCAPPVEWEIAGLSVTGAPVTPLALSLILLLIVGGALMVVGGGSRRSGG